MNIKEEIAKVKGLAIAIAHAIDAWFEKHFNPAVAAINPDQAKAELHDTLGTAADTKTDTAPKS